MSLSTESLDAVDIFDALTADRPYRAAMPTKRALAIMKDEVGIAIDPACFAALKRVLQSLR